MMIKMLKKILLEEGVSNFLHRKFYTKIKPFSKETVKTLRFNNKKFKLLLNPNNGYVDASIYAFKVFEKDILTKAVKYIKKDSVIFDIGANIGQHSIIFSLHGSHVYSFEPNNFIFEQFVKSISLNGISNITPLNYGIASEENVYDLYVNPKNVGNATLIKKNDFKHIKVNIKTLENFHQHIDKVDFVKIDVEGFELEVILGNQGFFEKFKPFVWLEFTPEWYKESKFTLTQLDDLIKKLDYKIYSFQRNQQIDNLANHTLIDDVFLYREGDINPEKI